MIYNSIIDTVTIGLAADRNHFRDYGEVMRERDSWASGIIKKFRKEFAMLREAARSCGNLNVTGRLPKGLKTKIVFVMLIQTGLTCRRTEEVTKIG